MVPSGFFGRQGSLRMTRRNTNFAKVISARTLSLQLLKWYPNRDSATLARWTINTSTTCKRACCVVSGSLACALGLYF